MNSASDEKDENSASSSKKRDPYHKLLLNDVQESSMLWGKRSRTKTKMFSPKKKEEQNDQEKDTKNPESSTSSTKKRKKSSRRIEPLKKKKTATPNKKKTTAPSAANSNKKNIHKKTPTTTSSNNHVKTMEKSFYEENGADWQGFDIDFNELSTLRGVWEFPAACHMLWLLQTPLKLKMFKSLREYEAAFLSPQNSPILDDIFTKLLLAKTERDRLHVGLGLSYSWWSKQLQEYYTNLYQQWYSLREKENSFESDDSDGDEENSGDDDGVMRSKLNKDDLDKLENLKLLLEPLGEKCPLEDKMFNDLPIEMRAKVLFNLCEIAIDDEINSEHLRGMEEDDLRVEPIGSDYSGNLFFFFPQFYQERRIYRLKVNQKNTPNKSNGRIISAGCWELFAKGEESIKAMMKAIEASRTLLANSKRKRRKLQGEVDLTDHLESILEQLENETESQLRLEEKQKRKAYLEALPRKRSTRIQIKQLVEFEKESLKSQEEMKKKEMKDISNHEKKQQELMRRLEKDKVREEHRILQEEKERQIAAKERENRAKRRLEKEEAEKKMLLDKQQSEIQKMKDRQRRANRRESMKQESEVWEEHEDIANEHSKMDLVDGS